MNAVVMGPKDALAKDTPAFVAIDVSEEYVHPSLTREIVVLPQIMQPPSRAHN